MGSVLLPVAIAVALLMSVLFVISLIIKKNDIVDIFWGPGIFLVTLIAYFTAPNPNTLNELLLVLTGLWAFRLAYRIYMRNHGKEEDFRYRKWREAWGQWFYVRSFFQIYFLQGSLMLVLGASAIHASVFSEAYQGFSILTYIGVVVWLIGYYFEVIADAELDHFISNRPPGKKILDTGLWKYSRHPNYFGEVTMWWGIWLMVAPLPMSYVALVSPVIITFLILKVSGVPMLEKKYEGDTAYEAYRAKTSMFIPLPPKQ